MDGQNYGLGDFLNKGLELYSSYQQADATADMAKIEQARAAAAAANAQNSAILSQKAKTLLLYGGGALILLVLVLALVKKFK